MIGPQDLLFFLAAFLSEAAGTMAGFGSSTIFLPISLFFFDFKTSIVLVAILHISGNVGRLGSAAGGSVGIVYLAHYLGYLK